MAPQAWLLIPGSNWATKLIILLTLLLGVQSIVQIFHSSSNKPSFISRVTLSLAYYRAMTSNVDLGWYPPSASAINNLTQVVDGTGIYGWVFNSSSVPESGYGVYNWCNMPHARATEYVKPSSEYELQYVEIIHRHHKRTVYASNSFPVESYGWDCNDEGLFYYGQPSSGNKSAHSYWQGYLSPTNPFKPSGFLGTCQFPQITAAGLDDSWQHGKDLYGVYHDLLRFLPDNLDEKVSFKVTQNVITSEVAGMVMNGMFNTEGNYPLLIEPSGFDSLEPTYPCQESSNLFGSIQSGANWTAHLTAASSLYATLDNISGVSPTDGGFHMSFDHYYDNLSARQCHQKPLPCKLVNGVNSTTCVTQDIADEVYRFGNYEYSYIYRDDPRSLAASAGSMGVFFGALTTHIRENVNGTSDVIYRHNVAHDGSMSRVLSVLQVDTMYWPGMGSEVIFELYKKSATVAPSCNHDNCLRQLIQSSAAASSFCPGYTSAPSTSVPSFASNCGGSPSRVSSACSCLVTPTATPAPSSSDEYYVRVLLGGQVLKSSNPSLGLIDMLPLETFLGYLDGLVGENASKVVALCNA